MYFARMRHVAAFVLRRFFHTPLVFRSFNMAFFLSPCLLIVPMAHHACARAPPAGIKDVLEQVSSLFADHPDLLREFTYFLPDPVQEQARERLNRAARCERYNRRCFNWL